MDRETLYRYLPAALQDVAVSLVGWRVQRRRFGGDFTSLLREAEERASWSRDRLAAYRDERLRNFIRHCVQSVPHYRDVFRDAGVDAGDIRGPEDLKRLPILTRAEVQENTSSFFSAAAVARVRARTSGTTGSGLRFFTTLRAVREQWAVWWRYRRWHGIEPGTWCAYFGGRLVVPSGQAEPPFWRINRPGRQILFSGYHMGPERLGAYVAELRARRPPWLHGYPSLLSLVASWMVESGQDLGYAVKWITVGAESLLPAQSATIERAFGVRPRQHYGMEEAAANISECEQGSLHVDEDFSAVEFVPNEGSEGHKIVGTNFTNPATPLLRYEVGDVVELSNRTCSCGRAGRVVERIEGRIDDYVVLGDGTRIGRLGPIFKDMVNIRQAQISQERPGEMLVRVVRGAGYSDEDEQMLIREMRKRVGEDAKLDVSYVEAIERTPAGKARLVIAHE